MTLLAVTNVDYATIMEMAVSHNRDKPALSRRTILRSLSARLKRPHLRWQVSGALMILVTVINLCSFVVVGNAAGIPIGCPGGPDGPPSPTANYSCPGGGSVINGVFTVPVGCPGGAAGPVSPTASYPCPGGGSIVKGVFTVPIGCPGGAAGPVAGTANYPCPGGGSVVNGTYFPDAATGRVQGKLTYSDGANKGNCSNSTIDVTRINGTPTGDASTTSAAEGTFVMNMGAGSITLNTSSCTAPNGNKYAGTSKTLTVAANKTIDGSFVATQLVSSAGAGQEVCDNANFTELNFWVCGLISLLSDTVKGLDAALLSAIKIDTDTIFNDSGTAKSGNAFFVAWASFRNIAYALLVVMALVMIVSQILGLDMVSAYEFRKLLPKFIIVVIIGAAMWNIQDFAYNASNDAADAVGAIIAAPFSKIDVSIGNTTSNEISMGVLIPALLTIGVPAGVAALALLGVGGIAALVASGFLTVASAWVLIEARDVVAELLIIISTLAIVSSLFTKKLYDIWLGATLTILLSVPAMAGILKIGQEAAKLSYVNNHAVVAMVILIAIYGLFWKTFKTVDKVSGQLGNAIGSATQKAQSALGDYRKNTRKRRTEEAIAGQRTIRGARMATNLMQRGRQADQGGLQALLPGRMGRNARIRYAGAEANHLSHTVAEMMKKDGGRSGGDDDAMEIAQQHGMNDNAFVQQYSQRLQGRGVDAAEADRRAGTALGTLRSSFGAQLGTDAMRVAAYRSLLDSKTSYADPTGANAQDNWEHMIGDGNALMADGLMTSTDVTMAIKSRADRADRAGVGFGTLQGQVERSYERQQHGAARGTRAAGAAGAGNPLGELVTETEAKNMRKEALFGTQAGGIVSGRHEAVSALSGVMRDNVEETVANVATAQAAETALAGNIAAAGGRDVVLASARAAGAGPLTAEQAAVVETTQAQEQFERQLAAIAGRYDAMGQVSPQNAEIMATNVMSQVLPNAPPIQVPGPGGTMVTVNNPTIQQLVEHNRGNQGFLEMRREYMNANMAAAAGATGGATTVTGPGTSDRRLKRNIESTGRFFKGMELFRFQYIWSDQTYVGFMAQDIMGSHPEAVSTDQNGFYRVNYAALGTQMYTLEQWESKHAENLQLTR
jgi:hypothetical protein